VILVRNPVGKDEAFRQRKVFACVLFASARHGHQDSEDHDPAHRMFLPPVTWLRLTPGQNLIFRWLQNVLLLLI